MELHINTNHNIAEKCELCEGDFLVKCLPNTFRYFNEIFSGNMSEKYDAFDAFIRNEVNTFSFLIDEFYKCNCPSEMRLSSYANESMLTHLDDMILEYLKCKSIENKYNIKEFYTLILEKKCVEMVKEKYNIKYKGNG